ncbi:MAG: glycosyltransferase family 4 protein [Pseudoxanthomonas sp.]
MILALNKELAGFDMDSCLLSINNYRSERQHLHDAAVAETQAAVLLPCRSRFDTDTLKALREEIVRRKARVLHVHDYKSAFYAILASRKLHVPIVATVHGWVNSSLSLRIYNRIEVAIMRRFDALIVVAESQIQRLLGAGLPRKRIHRIDNGIGIPARDGSATPLSRAALGIPEDAYLFAAVGRLAPEKNLALLLEAFAVQSARAPGSFLMLVGDGPDRAALESQAASLGLDGKILFTGNRDDVQAIYPLIDCLVMPSLSEGMPLVILEAMSHGIPIVASAVGEIPRLLSHTRTGRIVPPAELAPLEAAMRAAMEAPPGRDEGAREYVRRHHSSRAMASKYAEIYRMLMNEGRHVG